MDNIADTELPPATGYQIVEKLLRIAKLIRIQVDIAVRVADLHAGQDEMISVPTTEPTMSTSQIADRLNIRSSTVSKTTDKLVAKGLVERVPIKSDHRKTAVVLTAAGGETQALVREIWSGVEENLFSDLSSSETEEIRRGLELLNSRLRERVAEFRRPLQKSTPENELQN